MNRRILIAIALLFIGSTCWSQENQFIDSLKIELKGAETDSARFSIGLEIGYSLLYDNPDTARLYFQEALEIAEVNQDQDKMAKSLTLIGVTYYFNGQLDNAITHYLKALPISEELGNDRYSGIIANNIGAVYFDLRDYGQTKPYYEKAVALFTVAKDTFWLSNALNNLGNVLEKAKEYDQSLEVYGKALDLAKVSENNEAVGSTMSNIGNVYLGMKNFDEALRFYRNGLKLQLAADDQIGAAISYNNVGLILFEKGQLKEALLNHQKALQISKELNHLSTMKNAHKWLSFTYSEMNQYKNAYAHQTDFMMLDDSIAGLEKASLVEELNTKYETEKKDRQIALLELDKKSAALNLANSNNQRNIFVFGSVLLIVLAGSLYYRYYSKKRTSEILTEKNSQISIALEERETLLKEIHHRVKNNLQVISSLLNLQAGSLEDDAAIDAVREGQHRVKSMALIHQKLYSAEDIRGVDIQDYFENLTKELYRAFGVGHLMHEVSTNGLKLDIDTVIPLGLIVNELITNSIKYAFENVENGLLQIEVVEEAQKLHVWVRDNGRGMDEDALQKSNSFGWKMIRSLSRKLKAAIIVENDGGTSVHLILSRYKLVV